MQDIIIGLREELTGIYGKERAAAMTFRVIPSVLSDFLRMLDQAAPGSTVKEEYRLDDGKAALFLTGSRSFSGEKKITGWTVRRM